MGVGGRSRGPGLGSAQAGGAAPRTPGPVPPQEVRGGALLPEDQTGGGPLRGGSVACPRCRMYIIE